MVYLDTSIDHLIISIPSDCGFKTFIEETDPTVDGCENKKNSWWMDYPAKKKLIDSPSIW
jgi:hypothetical protein